MTSGLGVAVVVAVGSGAEMSNRWWDRFT